MQNHININLAYIPKRNRLRLQMLLIVSGVTETMRYSLTLELAPAPIKLLNILVALALPLAVLVLALLDTTGPASSCKRWNLPTPPGFMGFVLRAGNDELAPMPNLD